MRLTISHTTRYRFESPVSYGLQQLRKTPRTSGQQWVLNWATKVEGGRKELAFDDHHHNVVELVSFERDARELIVSSQGQIELNDTHGVVGRHTGPAPLWLFRRPTPLTQPGAGVRELVRQIQGASDLDRLHALTALVKDTVLYDTGHTDATSSAEDVLVARRGVCQDHTHVFVSCAREMGFPARYVSGYLLLGDRIEQEAMHAWAEAHVEGLGWVGFDAANGVSPDARYVRVATGLDYTEASPVTGTRIGGHGEELDVQIQVAQQ